MARNRKPAKKLKNARPGSKHDPKRRWFLGAFGKGVVGTALATGTVEAFAIKGVDFLSGLLGSAMENMNAPSLVSPASFRHGFLSERILGLNGLSFLNPGDLRLRLGNDPTPHHLSHERAALAPVKALLSSVQYLDHSFLKASPREHDSLVSSGSPVANDFSGLYLPVFALGDDPGPERRLLISRDTLPYHLATGDSHSVDVISGSQASSWVKKRNNAILEWHDGRRIRRPSGYVDPMGRLANDYLLLTRIPRSPAGGEILIIAGLHGAATQAFELLFHPDGFSDEECRYLAERLGDEPYFQVVLRAFDIVHESPMSRARQLAVSRLLPPVPIHFTPEFFNC